MTRKVSIFLNTARLTALDLFLRFAAYLFNIYLANIIGTDGLGMLEITLSIGYLANTAAAAGSRTTSMYLTAQELGKKQADSIPSIIHAVFGYNFLWSLPAAAALYVSAPFLSQYWIGNKEMLGPIRIMCCFIPVNALCGSLSGICTAQSHIPFLARIQLAEQLFYIAITGTYLMAMPAISAPEASSVLIAGSGLGTCLSLIALLLKFKILKQGRQTSFHYKVFRHALPLALGDNLKAGLTTAETAFVPKRLALHCGRQPALKTFGSLYGIFFPALMFPGAILSSLGLLLIPEIAKSKSAGFQKSIEYITKQSLKFSLIYGGFWAGTLCMALIPFFKRFQNIGQYFLWFSPLLPILYCDIITDAITKGLGFQSQCVKNNVITAFLDLALLYILLPAYGMHGYFLSFAVTHILNFILSVNILKKSLGNILPLWRFGIIWFVMAGSLLFSWILPVPYMKLPSFYILYLGGLYIANIFSYQDIQWTISLFIKKRPA